MRDDDIRTILDVEVNDEEFDVMLLSAGVPQSGDRLTDFKALSTALGIDPEDLLYALFVDEPLFDDDTWSNLTT